MIPLLAISDLLRQRSATTLNRPVPGTAATSKSFGFACSIRIRSPKGDKMIPRSSFLG